MHKAGVEVGERTLKSALKHDFTELILSISKILMTYYSAIPGNKDKFLYYINLVQEYKEINNLETVAEIHYSKLVIKFSNSRSTNKEIETQVDSSLQELAPFLEKYKSYRFNHIVYLLIVTKYQITNNYPQVISSSKQALQFFESLPYETPLSTRFSFLFRCVSSYLHLKKYSEAKQTIEKCLELTQTGKYNWNITLIYKAMLGFHSRNLELTYSALTQIKEHLAFMPNNLKEQWLIIEAYINFFKRIKKRPLKLSIASN